MKKIQAQVNIIDDDYVSVWSTTAVEERKKIYSGKPLKDIVTALPNLRHAAAYLLVNVFILYRPCKHLINRLC